MEPERVCSRCGVRYDGDVIFCPKDGTPLGEKKTEVADDPYIGIELSGQFKLEQLIGIGAMGRVYRAHQKGIERPVAVKILHRDLLRNPTVLTRFVREARVASRLSHPNVVQVLTTGEIQHVNGDVGGEAFLAMEYLDGISLRSALGAAGGALPLPRALHVVLQVCDAVGEAHTQGIVHRDLKPENVMLVRRGDDLDFAKVLDFGVARLEWADQSVATQAGVIFGTARYISPEGAQGKPVAAPSDVYSIAVILYQCLSGETPFDADNPVGILIKHTNEPPPDVRSVPRASYVPEPLARVILANMAKEPSERCRNARELGRALIDAARASGLSPDDLVARSTLLGQGHAALQLQSLQRTKSLALSGDDPPPQKSGGGTQLLDDRPSAREAEARPSRPSAIEPTIMDEPVSELVSSPRASAPPVSSPRASAPPASSPRSSLPARETEASESAPLSARISFPDSGWEPPPEIPLSPARRWLIIMGCFVVGAAIAFLVAQKMGVFAPPDPGVADYADRASSALAAKAWNSPPGENVREITDAALRRWPGAPSIVAVRARAAGELVQEATNVRASDAARAYSLAELAVGLDPSNEKARSLMSEIGREQSAADAEPAPSTSGNAPKRPKGARVPVPGAPPSATPTPSATEPAPATSPGGRWL
jgi:eukaryotic-like serine/threonine-protein kinase